MQTSRRDIPKQKNLPSHCHPDDLMSNDDVLLWRDSYMNYICYAFICSVFAPHNPMHNLVWYILSPCGVSSSNSDMITLYQYARNIATLDLVRFCQKKIIIKSKNEKSMTEEHFLE